MSELWPAGRRAVLEWGVKRSLLEYMSRDPAFAWDADDVDFNPAIGVRLAAVTTASGGLDASGSLVLRAHAGALTVPLVGVRLQNGELTIDDPVDGAPARLSLVVLGEPVATADGYEFATTLAASADSLFLYNYVPKTQFDPIRVRLGDDIG
jgi:hypothetical protein